MITSTQSIYYEDTYLDKLSPNIGSQDENGNYVSFGKTTFPPQSGEQPADKGYFEIENDNQIRNVKIGYEIK